MVDAHLDYGGWEWHYDTSTPNTLGWALMTGVNTEVIIPTNLDGSTALTTIGVSCFTTADGPMITKVLGMPSTVTTINYAAFQNCGSLTYINIGDGVTIIGNEAFRSCSSLTSLRIPDTVTNIGIATFDSCSNLKTVTIGGSVTSIGGNAFRLGDLSHMNFNGLVKPTSVGSSWVFLNYTVQRGHARVHSDFPVPGKVFPAKSDPQTADDNHIMMGGFLQYGDATGNIQYS